MEGKVCPRHPELGVQPPEAFGSDRSRCDGLQCYCRRCQRVYRVANVANGNHSRWNKAYRLRLKTECFEAYGGLFCACCGESEFAFLTLDHIDGVVPDEHRDERRRYARAEAVRVYADLKRKGWPPGYQVLCMNCNWAKGKLGQCPHEIARQERVLRVA